MSAPARRSLVPLLAALALAVPHPVLANPCLPHWEDGPPVAGLGGGRGNCALVWDDGTGAALYVGGEFVQAGTKRTKGLARWDGAEWSGIGDMTGSFVWAMTVWDGKLVVGGSFTSVGGVSAENVAAWDGTRWTPLGAGVGTQVRSLAVWNGLLVVGGNFTTAGGAPAGRIAMWDGASWSSPGGGVSSTSAAEVSALGILDGDLVAGGRFTSAGGVPVVNIARWDGTAWSALGDGLPTSSVQALAIVDPDGVGPAAPGLLAGGNLSVTTPYIRGLAFWDGATWSQFAGGTENFGQVWTIALIGEDLWVGGNFANVAGGTPAKRIARWNAAGGWSAVGPGLDGDGAPAARAIAEFDGEACVTGEFFHDGSRALHGIARWDGAEWWPLGGSFGGHSDARIEALLPWGDGVVVGGSFTTAGDGVEANNVAQWTPTGWSALGPGLGTGTTSASVVTDLVQHAGEVHAAWNESVTSRISRWDGGSWTQVAALAASGGRFEALLSAGDSLYAAGSFLSLGGVVNRVAVWNGATWSALGAGTPGVNGTAWALASFEGDVLVGGQFTQAGGAAANRVARWDGAAWSDMGAGLPASGSVYAFAMHGGVLHAATSGGVYRWNGTTWTRIVNASEVRGLVSVGDDLYFAGSFLVADSRPAKRLARWDGVRSWAVGAGLDASTASGVAQAIAVLADGSVVVGSNFRLGGQRVSHAFARFRPCAVVASGGVAGDRGAPRQMPGGAERGDVASGGAAGAATWTLAPRSTGPAGTAVALELPRSADVRLTVYDVAGRTVARVPERTLAGGRHVLDWADLTGAVRPPSGVYFVRAEVRRGGREEARVARIVVVR